MSARIRMVDVFAALLNGGIIEERHQISGVDRYEVLDSMGVSTYTHITQKQFEELQSKKLLEGKEIKSTRFYVKVVRHRLALQNFAYHSLLAFETKQMDVQSSRKRDVAEPIVVNDFPKSKCHFANIECPYPIKDCAYCNLVEGFPDEDAEIPQF